MIPLPTQHSGSLFLARNKNALLADEPRVGKTGAAIMGADLNIERDILVITTASGRPVWNRAFGAWSDFGRSVRILSEPPSHSMKLAGATIVGWGQIAEPTMRAALLARRFDRAILDEAHAAKNFQTKRTQAVFGTLRDDGAVLDTTASIAARAAGTWLLTGTPLPHDPSDIYPALRALAPERLAADQARGWPDVTRYSAFESRYCVVRMKKTSRFRRIPVIVGGRNTEELNARLQGFMLKRTQKEVGIREPRYELLPLQVSAAMRRQAEGDVDREAILKAIDEGKTRDLEMHLGALRRNTGVLKARAVVDAVKDEFEGGLDKIVLMYWHKEVGDALALGLEKFGVLRLDGATSPAQRGPLEQAFLHDNSKRVFLGQIVAAGEAIDLSSAAVLWFVEQSFTPKDMKQAALRITNHNQTRQVLVRVCVIEESIDEAIQASLMRLWTAIREVLG